MTRRSALLPRHHVADLLVVTVVVLVVVALAMMLAMMNPNSGCQQVDVVSWNTNVA